MEHSANGGMGHDMPMHDMCKMNMLFTWEWENTCVVYKWWHVKTAPGFVGTVLALVLLSMFYEFTRSWISLWKARWTPNSIAPNTPLVSGRASKSIRIKSAALYAFQVGFSFMLMLVFMTYNGWYMLAIVAGAGFGFYLWGDEKEAKSMLCH
ncbi:Ctr copper transporter [Metschnikowia bicuspidata var. bicuspidata NRRL YB-4993]|uniref:Copper transport protein n=1 Tax=Metschnikowia bicuspidata var. bicuspidata NRRL YB-4993 TaxID=869754 RepID=A0A1A0H6E6_9ASCO|nr:Ctr copper transporter [Metschnikowia bicuspidata var. bicuspidata NRRL YB-4993]OBA19601.1 Ctr copper transporter [Metschnikowia bicuspidata var. bicuspidata NRRL YB-4993]